MVMNTRKHYFLLTFIDFVFVFTVINEGVAIGVAFSSDGVVVVHVVVSVSVFDVVLVAVTEFKVVLITVVFFCAPAKRTVAARCSL